MIQRNIRRVVFFATLMVACLSVHPAWAAERIVGGSAGAYPTIQSAIDASRDGDSILITAGIWYETIDLRGKAVVLSPLDGDVVLDADGAGSVIRCVQGEGTGTVIEGLVIRGGFAKRGAGLLTRNSTPTIRDCTFEANESTADGAAWAGDRGGPTFVGCLFLGNIAGDGDTVSCGLDCTPVMIDCSFIGNCPQPQVNDRPVANASNLVEDLPVACQQAIDLAEGSTPFATTCAAREKPRSPSCELEGMAGTIASDIWYRYVPGTSGLLRLSTCGSSDFDTDLTVYRGECGDLELIACNDDARNCPDGASELVLPVRMDDPLLIRIGGGIAAAAGTGRLRAELQPVHGANVPKPLPSMAPRSGAVTHTVCASGCSHTTIQSAVDAAVDGDTIVILQSGVYNENLTIAGKQLTLSGLISMGVIIDGGMNGPTVTLDDSMVDLNYLVIQNGRNDAEEDGLGGGIFANDTIAYIRNCIVTENTAGRGGGIGAVSSRVYTRNTEITRNVADSGGGIYGLGLQYFTSYNTTCSDNQGGGLELVAGGALPFRITRGLFERNAGDAITVTGAPLTCTNSLVAGNRGAGIRFNGDSTELHVLQCTVAHNAIAGGDQLSTAGVRIVGTDNWKIHNSILWGNRNEYGRTKNAQISYESLPGDALRHVSIEGSFDLDDSTTIIGQTPWGDPMFEDPCGPDGFAGTGDGESYRLLTGSAAVDAGDRNLTYINLPYWDPDALGFVPWYDLDGVEHDIDAIDDLSSPIGVPSTGPTPDLGCYEFDASGTGQTFVWSNLSPSTSSWQISVNWLPYTVPNASDSILLHQRLLENTGAPTSVDNTIQRMHVGHGDWIFNAGTGELSVDDSILIGHMAVPLNENPDTPETSTLYIGNGFDLSTTDMLIDGYGNGRFIVAAQDPDDGPRTRFDCTGTMTLVRGGRLVMDGSQYDSLIEGGGTIENLEGVFERIGSGDTTIYGNYVQRTPPPGPLGQKYPTAAGTMVWNAGTQLTVSGTVELGGVLNMSLSSARGGGTLPILECLTPGGISGQVVLQTDLPSDLFFKVTTSSSRSDGTLLSGTITPLDLVFGLNEADETNPSNLPIDAKLADIDDDDLLDLAFVMDENLVVMFNRGDRDGNGTWDGFDSFGDAVTVSFIGSTPTALAIGDYDGKGPLDIVVSINQGTAAGTVQIVTDITGLRPAVEVVTLSAPSDPVDVCLLDLDGDDDLDILVASETDASLRLIENDATPRGGPRAREATKIPVPDSPPFKIDPSEEEDSKDSDNAGLLVSSRKSKTGKFFSKSQNSRSVGLELEATVSMSGETVDLAVGDFDENGVEDFVALNQDTNSFSIFLREESDSDDFTELSGAATISLLTFNNPVSVDTGDFDNDGDIDLVIVATPNDGPGVEREPVARIWLNTRYANGDPVPSEWMTFVDSGSDLASSGTPVLVVAGDVDNVGGFPSQVGDDVVILGSSTGLRNDTSTILPNVGGPIMLSDATEFATAFNSALDGDVLVLAPGTYVLDERLDFGNRNLTLLGGVDDDGQPTTTIVGPPSQRTLWLVGGQTSATRISNLIIEAGTDGAGIYMEDTGDPGPVLSNCIIQDASWTSHGAGLRLNNAHPTLLQCVIQSNTCVGPTNALGGGIYLYNGGSLQATGCQLRSNQARSGGAIYANTGTELALEGCTTSDNTATENCGGLFLNSTIGCSIQSCAFTGNAAKLTGGGMYINTSNAVIDDTIFSNNQAGSLSGAVHLWNAFPVLSGCTITGNLASSGGAIYSNGTSNPTVVDSTICGNSIEQIVGSFVDIGNCISDLCDGDGDGTPDCIDGCPDDPDKTAPGTCGCGATDDDGDGDGTPDCIDGCPDDPDKTAPGTCGCGVPDDDGDGDGTPDCNDGCPDDPDKTVPGTCGCGVPDDDVDGDGITDCLQLDCDGDIDGSSTVDVSDLLSILADWGPCEPEASCSGDINGDQFVDVLDLLAVLANWGSCPLPGPWLGCTGTESINESDYGCSCFVDGDSNFDDCNPGLNGDGTMTPYRFGLLACGEASVYQDIGGSISRDTDWWDDGGVLDAGGSFDLQVASRTPKILAVVDLDSVTFVDLIVSSPEEWSEPLTVELAPGNYCLWIAPTWDTSWTCERGLAEYSFRVSRN